MRFTIPPPPENSVCYTGSSKTNKFDEAHVELSLLPLISKNGSNGRKRKSPVGVRNY